MSPFIFQKYWCIVGQDVIAIVLSILNYGHTLHKMNFTHIVLIRKKNDPKHMCDCRPKSFSNVISRIISKVLSNRLKHVLPMIIFDAQSAFVPNRLINDNTTVAYELLHRMRSRRKGRMGYMVVKLDISKAYDGVEWGFLRQIMLKMGFDPRWVHLAMETITTASYSILINAEPQGFINPSRVIRQGYPISSYLFLLCAEGLSTMLRKAEESHNMRGIKSNQHGVCTSHHFFADGSLLFYRATMEECQRLLNLWGVYKAASSQAINRQKTSLFFSKNTKPEVKEAIKQMMGARIMSNCEKHLGLPMVSGKSKVNTFKELQEKITKKVMEWKEKFVSKAG